jgi:dopamine beta-monooxygenase
VPVGPTGAKFFILQLHYNNPGHVANFVDSSGVKIWISDSIRQYDAGLLLIGPAVGRISLPPADSSYHIQGGCSSQSTAAISQLPTGKITLIGEAHHMHTFGRSIWTDIIRGGTIVRRFETLAYDYNSQVMRPSNYDILPGDSLKVHCIFNTMGATSRIPGCESTACEMCLYVVMYYPQTVVSNCHDTSMETNWKNCTYPCLT